MTNPSDFELWILLEIGHLDLGFFFFIFSRFHQCFLSYKNPVH